MVTVWGGEKGSGWWEVYTETWTNGSISSNSPSLNGYSGTSIGGKMSKSKQFHTRQISSPENWHHTRLINGESGLRVWCNSDIELPSFAAGILGSRPKDIFSYNWITEQSTDCGNRPFRSP